MTYRLSDLKIPHRSADVGGIIFVTLELSARYNLRRALSRQEKTSIVDFLQANIAVEKDPASKGMLSRLMMSVERDF